MRPRPMEARNPDARAMRADPAPVVAEKPPEPSPWQAHTLWLADPSAAPVEYLEPLKELGFTQLCVRATHGEDVLAIGAVCIKYRVAGWNVVYWGRCDQKLGEDVRADPIGASEAIYNSVGRKSPFAANVEIRWTEDDNAAFVGDDALMPFDALCTYPGGMPDSAHRYYQQAGVRVVLMQTFGETEPYSVPMDPQWGYDRGYEICIPMVGVFKGPNGYADAARQASHLGPSLPRHCYLVEQSGWRHMSGQGYEWENLMAGVR